MNTESQSKSFPFDLLEPRPSSDLKLSWALRDLGLEGKISILDSIEDDMRLRLSFQRTIAEASKDCNQYIRYRANKIARRILNNSGYSFDRDVVDPDLYCQFETGECLTFLDPELTLNERMDEQLTAVFPSLPYLHQIALLSTSRVRPLHFCTIIRKCMSCYLGGEAAQHNETAADDISNEEDGDNSKKSELHILCLVKEYVRSPNVQRLKRENVNPYDGFGEFLTQKDVDALWKLVALLPTDASIELIYELPPPGYSLTAEFIQSLSDNKRRHILWRQDLPIDDLRMVLFEKEIDKENPDIDFLNHRFEITDDLFDKILRKPASPRKDILYSLSDQRVSLTLYQLATARDTLQWNDSLGSKSAYSYEDAWHVEHHFSERVDRLSGYDLRREVRDFLIYTIAVRLVPWQKRDGLVRDLYMERYGDFVIEGDRRKTFLNLSSAISGFLPTELRFEEDEILFGNGNQGGSRIDQLTDSEIKELDLLENYRSDRFC